MLSQSINSLQFRPVIRSFILVVLAAFVLSVGGCGGGVTGTYVAEEKLPEGGTMTMTLELKGGNKAVMTMKGGPSKDAAMTVEGTYSVAGDKVSVMLSGSTDVYTLKDGTLTIKAMGDTVVLKKK